MESDIAVTLSYLIKEIEDTVNCEMNYDCIQHFSTK